MSVHPTVNLSGLLSPAQLVSVRRIMNSSTDSIQRTTRLKVYFGTFREQLLAKGVLPEYLAYAVEYAATKGKP